MGGWVFYSSRDAYSTGNYALDPRKCGKWMYFFTGQAGHDYIAKICEKAIREGTVVQSKHSDSITQGTSCFYINGDDKIAHKRVLTFFS
eukprot:UN00842